MNFDVSKKSRQNQRSAICFRKFLPCPLSSSCCHWGCPLAVCATPCFPVFLVCFWRVFFGFFVCFILFCFVLFFLLLRLPPSGQGSLLVILGPKPQSPEAGRNSAGSASCAELTAGSIRSSQGVLQEPKQECAGSNLLCFGKTMY